MEKYLREIEELEKLEAEQLRKIRRHRQRRNIWRHEIKVYSRRFRLHCLKLGLIFLAMTLFYGVMLQFGKGYFAFVILGALGLILWPETLG